jgi:hypothetical protein
MPADEQAIMQVPGSAWKPGITQDGGTGQDKEVTGVTGLMTRAGNWPKGLRWIARRVKPSRRHMRNLTGYEKKTGWKYPITCTNIPTTVSPPSRAATTRSSSTWPTASTPSWRPAASGPRKPWACGTCRQSPGRSTAAGSPPRTSPPTSPPGPGSPATATTKNSGTPTRSRSAIASGTCPPGSQPTPASGSSPPAATGHGRRRSSPAGTASAPCQHPPDQHKLAPQPRKEDHPARSEPTRTRANRATAHPATWKETDTRSKTEVGTISNQASRRLNDRG